MTREEFNAKSWGAGEKALYQGYVYDIAAVCFTEGLLGLDVFGDDESLSYVRCESIELINDEKDISSCASCRKVKKVSEMLTCMDSRPMHRYVCNDKCMSNFYA